MFSVISVVNLVPSGPASTGWGTGKSTADSQPQSGQPSKQQQVCVFCTLFDLQGFKDCSYSKLSKLIALEALQSITDCIN